MNSVRTKTANDLAIAVELGFAGPLVNVRAREDKKNYAERFSKALATKVANGLRGSFPGILPNSDGSRQESRARTSRGVKKLDVNYSTPELGLGLGVSIKTINFRDPRSKRYTKNYSRVDNELRAEAHDYHERQPFAVMIALVFLPADACDDGIGGNPSSFGAAVQSFRSRGGRVRPVGGEGLFEGVFIGLYEPTGLSRGDVNFFDVQDTPPLHGRPGNWFKFPELFGRITSVYDQRNSPAQIWA